MKVSKILVVLFLILGISCGKRLNFNRRRSFKGVSPVKVEVFYETLCGDCTGYLSHELFKVWNETLPYGIMSLQLYPYGNARQTQKPDGSWSFTCQHGQDECKGNIIEACIIARAGSDPIKYFPTIQCMEGAEDPVAAAENCVKERSKFDFKDIMTCAEGPEGNKLHHEFGVKTDSLRPEHQYVPWIVVDGNHTEEMQTEAQEDLLKLVCKLYKGKKRPSVCGKSRLAQDLEKLFDAVSINVV